MATGGCGEAATSKPRGEALENPGNTLILDFQPPEL